jgi:undecaprenyl-diphosphatase
MPAIYHITYFQAVVIGLIQGLTELFPISSLGHTVLIPSWLGGTWATLVRQESSSESPYLAFIVGLHLATAVVLIGYYAKTWGRIIRGFFTSIAARRVESADQKLAWLLIIATIPVGVVGLVLEHPFRVLFAKPLAAAIFLTINGFILGGAEILRRREKAALRAGVPQREPVTQPAGVTQPARAARPAGGAHAAEPSRLRGERDERDAMLDQDAEKRLAGVGAKSALWIGASQILALFAGISREGVTMAGGLVRGLSHEDALRFSFLLSTPVIFAAGVLKLSDLTGSLGQGVRGQVIAGSIAAAATSLFAVVFLSRYFRTRTLTPFAIYCIAAGLISIIRFGIF